MSLVKWKRDDFFPTLDTLWNNFFNDDFIHKGLQLGTTVPPVNVKETEKAYHVSVAVPGLKKEDFKVEAENGVLTISSEHRDSKHEKDDKDGAKVTRTEYNYSSFSRSFALPENASENNIEAEYKDGVLKIDIEKTTPSKIEKKKAIEVK